MTKRERLQLLITGKTPKILEGFKAFDVGVAELKSKLEENIRLATLDEISGKMNDLKKSMNFNPILSAISTLKAEIETNDAKEAKDLEVKLASLKDELKNADTANTNGIKDLTDEIQSIQTQIADILSRKPIEIPDFAKQIRESETKVINLVNNIETYDDTEVKKEIKDLIKDLERVRLELTNRINNRGGGNMNRQMLIGGVDPLTKYTDVNLKAGTGVTITYADNQTTKKVDITITATGSGSGITRQITSVSTNTNAGNTAGIDYVYLCSGTMTLTLPTAANNANLYTIKNVGTGVVTVATTGLETIDGDTSVIMPVQYTSVDIISDNTTWKIT